MLDRIRIQNFRALRDLTIDLAPLTVLLGPNGCGKSSVLRALDPQVPGPQDLWRHQALVASVMLQEATVGKSVSWSHRDGGTWPRRDYTFQLLHLDPNRIRSSAQLTEQKRLSVEGGGLVNVFFSLTRSRQEALARRFCTLVPTFSDVDTQAVETAGEHELRFQDRWDPNVWYRPAEVSDGSALLLAYLVVDQQTPRPTLLAIEEPERGLHPYLLGELVKVLRDLTTRGIQVVLATHSAELLEYVKPEEVRFLTRDPGDGAVGVETVSTADPGWEEAWEAHQRSLGSVWLSGGLGGVPGT